jgi:hypothetical protein
MPFDHLHTYPSKVALAMTFDDPNLYSSNSQFFEGSFQSEQLIEKLQNNDCNLVRAQTFTASGW